MDQGKILKIGRSSEISKYLQEIQNDKISKRISATLSSTTYEDLEETPDLIRNRNPSDKLNFNQVDDVLLNEKKKAEAATTIN